MKIILSESQFLRLIKKTIKTPIVEQTSQKDDKYDYINKVFMWFANPKLSYDEKVKHIPNFISKNFVNKDSEVIELGQNGTQVNRQSISDFLNEICMTNEKYVLKSMEVQNDGKFSVIYVNHGQLSNKDNIPGF